MSAFFLLCRRLQRGVLTVGFILLAPAGAAALAGAPAPSEAMVAARVALQITPGKTDAPTESVAVSLADGTAELAVARRDAVGRLLAERRIPMTRTLFDEIWDLASQDSLDVFRPEPSGRAPDFGERGLEVSWTVADSGAAVDHRATWTQPLANGEAIKRLAGRLGALAREQVPDVALHYFP